MKTIMITGASGFVGRRLSRNFLEKGCRVIGLGTSPRHPFSHQYKAFEWIQADTTREGEWQDRVPEADIIVNLAGRTIFKKWTRKYKQAIYDSRIETTKNIVTAMEPGNTQKLLSTSAAGFYGDGGDEILTEAGLSGSDFLARLSRAWENEAEKAADKGTIVAIMRFGVILGKEGGALSVMAPAFRFFVGGPLGSGMQWFPWIHIQDIEGGVTFLAETRDAEGVFNFTAPEPVRQKTFARALGRSLNRPAVMPAPSFMVKTVMGELGSSLLQSQRVVPERLQNAGYRFLFKELDAALADLFKAAG
ncbi:MAG TPA: TIGR01777 family oxidoreductase [Desulfobacteraceae bacterium]|nr:TIGR01777 family oxidoreductase [Desulfobacteraceae bacterium]